METVEILAGGEFANAVKSLGLTSAVCTYHDILIYLCDEIGASTERNVCACTIDLARQNNLTLAELFKKYLG